MNDDKHHHLVTQVSPAQNYVQSADIIPATLPRILDQYRIHTWLVPHAGTRPRCKQAINIRRITLHASHRVLIILRQIVLQQEVQVGGDTLFSYIVYLWC